MNDRRLRRPLLLALVAAHFGLGVLEVSAATIVVTTTDPGVHGDNTCSLQEAIFSANYDDNVAPFPASPTQFVVTGCNKGNGNDTIVLQSGAVYQMTAPTVDPANPFGPTATPLVFSNITINANGATIAGPNSGASLRAFAVGSATVDLSAIDPGRVVSGTGQLTVNNVHVSGFAAKGGNGAAGGGGGMGAGGAIYLRDGELTLVNSTFDGNTARGGAGSANGSDSAGGGGGGLAGNGGPAGGGSGGGGGGSSGNGGPGSGQGPYGGGGGGTFRDGIIAIAGVNCGGRGGGPDEHEDGQASGCDGGGGGGGSATFGFASDTYSASGGNGAYGGGGGGCDDSVTFRPTTLGGGNGGNGGFGGAGGGGMYVSGYDGGVGGNGGFGAGGGAGGDAGTGGLFGGNANATNGGGGAGLGGAIFNDNGTLSAYNCTFTNNKTFAGLSAGANDGEAHGNAIFSHNGTCLLTHITVSGNGDSNNSTSGDLVVEADNNTVTLHLSNSIVANNNAGGVNGVAYSFSGGSVAQNNSGNLIQNAGFSTGNTIAISGSAISADPQVGPLQLNAPGNTATMAIGPSSPAYAKADPARTLPTDQRGVSRKSPADIGAYESNDFTQSGTTLVVTTTSDHTPDVCSVVDCTLREAIARANQLNGANTITFGANVTGTITLQAALGRLNVTDSTTIVGPGARVLAVSGSAGGLVFRVFSFTGGVNTVSQLTIRDGSQIAGADTSAGGAGISNAANTFLTVNDCAFVLNTAEAGDSSTSAGTGATAQGGAILNDGTLTLNRCTFSGNTAIGGRGGDAPGGIGGNVHGGNGGDAHGGAVFNDTNATLTINNSTFSGNAASAGGGGNGQFGGNGGTATGGVFNLGTMTITAATLSGNSGFGGAGGAGNNQFNGGSSGTGNGGLSAVSGTSTIRNTISANNNGSHGGGADVDGPFTSAGYNLIGIGDSSTGFPGTGDQVGTAAQPLDPKLGLLQDNGGPTNTFALLTGSTAIDKGKAFGLSTDQRSFSRTIGTAAVSGGDGTDIGAFESNSSALPSPTPTSTPTATPSATPFGTPNPTTLANVSTRMRVETGDNVLIGGFIVSGTQSKKIVVLATGPSLSQFFTGTLADPILELYSGSTLLESNDNWIDSPNKQAIIDSGFAPTNDLESAIITTLPANNSQYTAIVRGVNGGTGVGTVQFYDLDRSVDSKLANISTRGLVQTGDNVMIAGTIILGQTTQKVIVRAIGPSLPFPGTLQDPTLELRDGNGALLDSNDNWIDSPNKQAIIDSTIPPTNDAESAIVATLPSGGAQYTAIVRGVNDTTGIALVEIYALP